MAAFADGELTVAAHWLSRQQGEHDEEERADSRPAREAWYYRKALARLSLVAEAAWDEGHDKLGMAVPVRGYRGGVATVTVYPGRVIGYLPGHEKPAFVWSVGEWQPEMTDWLAARRDKAVDDHRAGLTEPMGDCPA